MKLGQSANESVYIVLRAGSEIKGAFTAAGLTSLGAEQADGTLEPIGITSAETESAGVGDRVNVITQGRTPWQAGEAITAGDMLSATEGGLCVKATAGKYIFARALESASQGAAVLVQIINAGYKGNE